MDTRSRRRGALAVWLFVFAGHAPAVEAQTVSHVRAGSPALRRLLDSGQTQSGTLRQLVAQLDASDLIVYVVCGDVASESSPRFGGELQFLSSTAVVRYVVARLNCRLTPWQRIPLLAHELRHAVEVADAASIVDRPSFGRYYAIHGLERSVHGGQMTYETDAAISSQAAVRRELFDRVAREHNGVQDE